MATPAHRLIQDQNFQCNGTTPGGMNDVAKADKRGGLGGRKALNDISNSRKLSGFHSVKKVNSTNVITIDKDPSAVGRKSCRATEKDKVGRKALTDLTNSIKLRPGQQQASILSRKLNAVAENVTEEGFLHNHMECMKAQMTAVDKDYFLKSVGLSKPSARKALPLPSKKLENNMKYSKMEEFLEHVVEDQVSEFRELELPSCCSPACRSPQSPKAPYMSWEGHNFGGMMMIETPNLK